MGAWHVLVPRAVPESLGIIIPIEPGTTPSAQALDLPVQLDALPLFAGDGVLAGMGVEVHCCATFEK